ncbi:hypothetical protein BU17DRAFT_77225 [Hysterangium stoloniferum]|nr:hypothetical protein BU17DRAFT_77225 [Hysterangium stoloniferum]
MIVHIVYIHGFQGDHTSFQSFPTDLHNALELLLPAHISLKSTVYPTYQSKKPIALAATNFLRWIDTLPNGPIILCGHSMGGLLAADAAMTAKPGKIIAILACDVPYLGMHPHVVVSGLASLIPKKGDPGATLKTEKEMNDKHSVRVMEQGENGELVPPPLPPRPSSCPPLSSPLPTPTPPSASPSYPLPASATDLLTYTLTLLHIPSAPILAFLHTDHRSYFTKQRAVALKRSILESMEFGVCMFDPQGLLERYRILHWESVRIHGAKDEVEAHCGLFVRNLNWEYDAFVKRTADVVKGWVIEASV